MATYLLDSSVIIDVLNKRHGRGAFLEGLLSQGHLLACCSINVTEVYAGMKAMEQQGTDELLESLAFYDVTWEVARMAGLLKRDWARRGRTLGVMDATIAAVALAYDLTLVTDNGKDYPMPEIRLHRLPAEN